MDWPTSCCKPDTDSSQGSSVSFFNLSLQVDGNLKSFISSLVALTSTFMNLLGIKPAAAWAYLKTCQVHISANLFTEIKAKARWCLFTFEVHWWKSLVTDTRHLGLNLNLKMISWIRCSLTAVQILWTQYELSNLSPQQTCQVLFLSKMFT